MRLIAWLVFTPLKTGLSLFGMFVVWNVGQGQWASLIEPSRCLHIDIGGEVYPQGTNLCIGKQNQLLLSHLDWDHRSFLRKFHIKAPLCTLTAGSVFSNIDICPPRADEARLRSFKPCGLSPHKNSGSTIAIVDEEILLPGDSTKAMESLWARHLKSTIRVLVLGHHGSNTSTGTHLLTHMPNLKMAIASARQSRYGHPHPKVQERLRRRGISIIRTENWGHIAMAWPKRQQASNSPRIVRFRPENRLGTQALNHRRQACK